jgi:uncharacterized membrane protein
MITLEKAISFLAGICLIGVIYLINADKDTTILMPILTAFVGWLLAKKEQAIGAILSGKK